MIQLKGCLKSLLSHKQSIKEWESRNISGRKETSLDNLDAWKYHWHYLSNKELWFSWTPYNKRSMTVRSAI